jgi:hypothetical protein
MQMLLNSAILAGGATAIALPLETLAARWRDDALVARAVARAHR